MGGEPSSNEESRDRTKTLLAVVIVAAVGIASIGLPAVYGGMTTTADAAGPSVESYETVAQAESELGAADEVYLREDGGAVLRYDNGDESDVDRFDLSMDANEGLIHMLVADDLEGGSEDVESANFSAVLDQSGLSGDGSLVAQRPEGVDDLSVDINGEVTDETNQFEATATGTFESDAVSTGSVSTDGYVTATPDRLETAGTVSVESSTSFSGEGTSMNVSLQDTADGYVVDVARERTLFDWQAGDWETRDQAKRTLQRQYGNLSTELGGTSEVRITRYDFEERATGQHRLDIAFTVEYSGIDDSVERRLADELATDQSMDLSRSEAESIATSVTDLEIETLEFTMRESDGSMTVEWEFAIANYDELTLAMLDLAESSAADGGFGQADIETARTTIEAQQAADLTWELNWDGSIEQTSSGTLELDAELTSDTENWAAYIDELEANDIETPNDVTFSVTAETDGDELAVDGQFDFEAEDLATQAVEAMAQSTRSSPTAGSGTAEANQFVSTVAESELEVARVDASITDDTVRVEGGAKFENMSAVTDSISDTVAIGGIATDTDDASTYVYVDSMGDVDASSATKSDIEHLGVVDGETTVHQAGEWDEEFPEVDTASIQRYLGLETTADTDEDESDSVPGFGAGVGIAAIAGLLATVAIRRRA
ncbi:hypothetical protein [Natrinema salaciae]|uniref:PGF-CTERM protein n=1 Tax=Natrinema salaciae TaxID=1186196 RepID=A0A1H9RMX0_9EURY|nr:hypothetical protein [Natrinema salaciae]SER73289.1 hypothetical protein SAMN04489841_4443 [Natrinema salaciae]